MCQRLPHESTAVNCEICGKPADHNPLWECEGCHRAICCACIGDFDHKWLCHECRAKEQHSIMAPCELCGERSILDQGLCPVCAAIYDNAYQELTDDGLDRLAEDIFQ